MHSQHEELLQACYCWHRVHFGVSESTGRLSRCGLWYHNLESGRAMTDHQAGRELQDVLNGLNDLPLELFNVNIWAQLPSEDRSRLRLTCQPMRQTGNELITAATFGMTPNSPHANILDDEDAASWPAGHPWVAWHREADARYAFLAVRLPRLSDLHLYGWSREADLMGWLMRFGKAGGRPTTLRLDEGALTMAGACAIQIALPQLQHLVLGRCRLRDRFKAWRLMLHGDVFLPLHQSTLASLYLGGLGCPCSPAALSSVAGLLQLRSLTITSAVPSKALLSFSNLRSLQHCNINTWCWSDELAFVHAAALFSLTRLTHLELPKLAHSGGGGAGGAGGPGGNAQWLAAATLLGGLLNLQSLVLGESFTINDAVMAALARLPQLSRLQAASVQLSRRSAGLLPGLQSLDLVGYHRPSAHLRSMLALLPLPKLTKVGQWYVDISCTNAGVAAAGDAGGAAEAATQVAALAQLAHQLAAAPRPEETSFVFKHTQTGVPSAQHLPVQAVLSSLSPLALRVAHVSFMAGVDAVGVDWGLVGRALPSLQTLRHL